MRAVNQSITETEGRRVRRSSLATGLLILYLVYTLLPLFWLIVSATKNNSDLFSSFGLWFTRRFNLLTNLREVFTYNGGQYVRWLANTAVYAVTSAVGAALLATLAGYALAKFEFRGRRALLAIILGSIVVPQTALVIPIYLLLSKIHLINTPLAVILPSLVSPFGVYLMRVYAGSSVPDEILDAARVDGAGELRIFRTVVFRILTPGFATVLLFTFVATWNNYFLPLVVLSNPKFYPLTVGLASWNAQASAAGGAQVLYTLVITGALVAIIPIIAAFLFLQRYWRGALAFGSVR
jgi:multiple sugar transport system permease protein